MKALVAAEKTFYMVQKLFNWIENVFDISSSITQKLFSKFPLLKELKFSRKIYS